MVIKGATINDCVGCNEREIKEYIKYIEAETGGIVTRLTLEPVEDGDIKLDYVVVHRKFERIRRITGYLVGTVERWNNAKQAEERERVKHL